MDLPSCVTHTSREMIRLSHLAYDSPDMIQSEITAGKYGLSGWSLVWGPVFARPIIGHINNLAFVAQKGSGDDAELAVVIRGTTFDSIESWLDDLDAELEPWPYTGAGAAGAEVSKGLRHVFHQMTTETPSGENHVGSGALDQFLIGAGIGTIHVTGHSQGGATASMMAAWVDWLMRKNGKTQGLEVRPATFAGETAGNEAFATDLDDRFRGTWRFWNEHDVVPRAWSDLIAIDSIYDPEPTTPGLIKALIRVTIDLVGDADFTQPNGGGCKLSSTVVEKESFLDEVAHQLPRRPTSS